MTPNQEWKVPLSDLVYGQEEEDAVLAVLRSRWLTMGPKTAQFERAVADLVGARHAICVTSCTTGLYALLAAANIGPGDEVLVPSLTFAATVNVVVNRGATPVFCDIISPELPLIDPKEIARNLSPATRAVFTMDYAGYPCDYDAIGVALADYEAEHPILSESPGGGHIHLFEDAAHAIGGALDEMRALGNCGDAGVFSFFSNKNLAIGEGGMVVTNRDDLAQQIRLIRQHGLTSNTWERHLGGSIGYDGVMPGWNFRPTEIHAALGLAQMSRIEYIRERRKQIVQLYHQRLANIAEITMPFSHIKTWHEPALHIFPILFPDHPTRLKVREALQAQGIQTSFHYPPIHQFEYFQRNVPTAHVTLPQTENFAAREVTLPLHPNMIPEQVELIARTIEEALTR